MITIGPCKRKEVKKPENISLEITNRKLYWNNVPIIIPPSAYIMGYCMVREHKNVKIIFIDEEIRNMLSNISNECSKLHFDKRYVDYFRQTKEFYLAPWIPDVNKNERMSLKVLITPVTVKLVFYKRNIWKYVIRYLLIQNFSLLKDVQNVIWNFFMQIRKS